MRSKWKLLVAMAAAALVVPQLSAADDVQEQLSAMQERMQQLEEGIQAGEEELAQANRKVENQQELIEDSGLADRAGSSALMNFASKVVFDGFVAASYTFNANYPGARRVNENEGTVSEWDDDPSIYDDIGENVGALGITAPLHQNANTFQVDQVWFGMEKPATAESRGGFRADIVFGAAADYLGIPGEFDGEGDDEMADGDLPHIYQAYAQYLAPIGSHGILIKAGRYESLLGAELFRADENFNITRGILWTALQPDNHTGVLIEGECGDTGIDWALGIANNHTNDMWDTDNAKTGIGRVRWTGETASFAIAGLYGGDTGHYILHQGFDDASGGMDDHQDGAGRDADALPILDVVATWDPSESLSLWLNYTHLFDPIDNNVSSEFEMFGFAGAARWAITERTGISARLEYIRGDDVFEELYPFSTRWAWYGLESGRDASGDVDIWAVTGTIDHALTDNLTVKLEGRWDYADVKGSEDETYVNYCDGGGGGFGSGADSNCAYFEQADQWLALVQLLYRF